MREKDRPGDQRLDHRGGYPGLLTMTRGIALLFVLAAPFAAAQETDAAMLARARAILQQAPLIDTHNDLPSMLIERGGGDLAGLDLGVVHPELCADIP